MTVCAVAIHTTSVAQEQRTTKPIEASYGSEDLEVSHLAYVRVHVLQVCMC